MAPALQIEITPSIELFGQVARYLNGQLSLRQMEEWLARRTSWLMTAPDDDSKALAGIVELNLAEMSAGHATENELRQELVAFLAEHPTLTADSTGSRTESAIKPTEVPGWYRYSSVDIRLGAGSA